RHGKRVDEDVRARQSELGEKALRLLARVAHERPSNERKTLRRSRIRGDAQDSRGSIESAAREHGSKRVPERGRVADLGLIVGRRVHDRFDPPSGTCVRRRELTRWNWSQYSTNELQRITADRSNETAAIDNLERQR